MSFRGEFIRFAIACEALRFGEFTLKSGRESPYFFNAGLFNTGDRLARLGRFYAHALAHAELGVDVLFGPAYKGIPLVCTTAIAMAELGLGDRPYAFNRKEAKDHGEGGVLVGAPLAGDVLIVDDVITAGTSVNDSVEIIRAHGARPCGVLIALDREEKGPAGGSAVAEVTEKHGIPVVSVIALADILGFLCHTPDFQACLPAMQAYRDRYGV